MEEGGRERERQRQRERETERESAQSLLAARVIGTQMQDSTLSIDLSIHVPPIDASSPSRGTQALSFFSTVCVTIPWINKAWTPEMQPGFHVLALRSRAMGPWALFFFLGFYDVSLHYIQSSVEVVPDHTGLPTTVCGNAWPGQGQ